MPRLIASPRAPAIGRLRRKVRLSSNRLCALTAVWVVLTANGSFWSLFYSAHLSKAGSWTFAASLVVALVAFHALLFRLLSPGRTVRVVLSLMLLVAAAAGWFMDTYGIAIDAAMLRNAFQTNFTEAREFISTALIWRLTWQAFVPIGLLWMITPRVVSWPRALREYLVGVAATFAVVLVAGVPLFSHYASFFRNNDEARYLVAPANVVVGSANVARKALRGRQPFVQVGLDARREAAKSDKPLLLVMVVGETARASSFSLGGYSRNTNPRLSQREVFYFENVVSCGTATAVSVPCLFSDLPRTEFDLARADRRDNVLDILERAGLVVSWIDNQAGCKGVCARIPTRQARTAHPASCTDDDCRDDALLYALSDEMRRVSTDSLIVLHQMGSHGPAYYLRVPEDERRFEPVCATERIETCTREQILNTYDNTIAYTDLVIDGLIERLDAARDFDTVLLYVSDHGESLGEGGLYLHGQPYFIAPEVQKRVPMLLWFSIGAKERLRLEPSCLRERLKNAMSHDNVSHSLLGLADVQTVAYRPSLDVISGCRTRFESVARD